jgi:methylated-DNA-[protein]-cysteine S-methyltransferase
MNQINIQLRKTEIGEVVLGSFRDKLCLLSFRSREMTRTVDDRIKKELNAEFVERDEILEKTRTQLDEYLQGRRREFDIPVLMVGTDFQKSVWNELMKVPYGATSTYLQLAKDVGNEKAVRAVGNANAANPISIIVPCHRIIGSDGGIVGYGGGLSVKRRLLELERSNLADRRQDIRGQAADHSEDALEHQQQPHLSSWTGEPTGGLNRRPSYGEDN